jgi:hypothetical protein
MTIKTTVAVGIVAVSQGLVGAYIWRVHVQNAMERARTNPNPLRPYTITSVHSNDQPWSTTVLKAMRSNGDEAYLEGGSIHSVNLRSAGLNIFWNAGTNTKATTGTGVVPAYAPIGFNPNCDAFNSEMTGKSQVILGFKTIEVAFKKVDTDMKTGGKLVHSSDAWIAPALNCEALQRTESWTYNGQPRGTYTETATSALAGEPDPTLFTIPANVKEAPSTEAYFKSIGVPILPRVAARWAKEKEQRERLSARLYALIQRINREL